MVIGSEIKKTRPCVVISPDKMNRWIQTVIVAPLTTRKRTYPTRVNCEFQGKQGQVVLDQIRLDEIQTEQVILFGSKARGDAGDDADIDLLVIVERADWERKGQIRLTDARVSLEYDVLLNTHILDHARWTELAQHQATL